VNNPQNSLAINESYKKDIMLKKRKLWIQNYTARIQCTLANATVFTAKSDSFLFGHTVKMYSFS
jgi:hypothetical protein